MRFFLTLVFLFQCLFSFGQKEGMVWHFGYYAGVDFNAIPPTTTTSSIFTEEGCASIADPVTGQLLFYTNGIGVWDKNHVLMPACVTTPLIGHVSSTQSSVIVPKPGSSTLYYIFTTPSEVANYGPPTMCYSIVDLSLNGGNGNLTAINIPIIDSSTEKIAVVGNCNKSRYWIVGHKWNTDSFYAFQLTSTGLSAPTKTRIGTIHDNTTGSSLGFETIGYMKFSSDAKRIAYVAFQPLNIMELFDFDENTGLLSNAILDNTYSSMTGVYGCTFSPDNTRLYVSEINVGNIYQYNLMNTGAAAIIASKQIVGNSGNFCGAMQNAPNGKLYIAKNNSSFLDVINNPNGLGALCNFSSNTLSLGTGICKIGLPNIIESFLSKLTVPKFTAPTDSIVCAGDTVEAIQTTKGNFTIQPNTFHFNADSSKAFFYPMTTTTYTIVSTGLCASPDTSFFTIQVLPMPNAAFVFSPNTPALNDATISLINQSTNATLYQWFANNTFLSSTVDFTFSNPGVGDFCYTLLAENNLNCIDSVTHCFTILDTISDTTSSSIFVPTVFSPNGDGLNDILFILGKNIKLIDFSIYNRWGQLVFNSVKIEDGWNGEYRNFRCELGTYYYYLNYADAKGQRKIIKGDITLLR